MARAHIFSIIVLSALLILHWMIIGSAIRLDLLSVHLTLHVSVLMIVVDLVLCLLVTDLVVEVVLSWLLMNCVVVEFWSIVSLNCGNLLLILVTDLFPLGSDLLVLDKI